MIDTKALREKVLDLAIRGKLVPQDPNDEPATVLLERIREQKKQMVKDGKLKAKDIKNDTIIFKGDDNLHYEQFADGTVKCIEDEIPFELPKGWAWSRFKSFCYPISDGTHQTPTYTKNGYTFLSAKNVTSWKIDWDNVMYIPEELHIELSKRIKPQKGDILLAKNGTIGVAAIVDKEFDFDIYVTLALIRTVNNSINSQYLLNTIASSTVQSAFRNSLIGIGVQNLHLEHIREVLIPIAPHNEQVRITDKVLSLLPLLEIIETNKADLYSLMETTKSKILDLAIRGELVPQDPNDEPASVLLERIRAEKEELIKAGKIKRDKKESVIFKGDDNSYYEQYVDNTIKCIDDIIPFEIPDSWRWTRIISCSEEIFAGGDKPKSYSKIQTEQLQYPIYSNGVENNGLYGYTDIPKVIKPSVTVSGRGTIGFSCVRDKPFFPIIRLITITPSQLISVKFLNFIFKHLMESGTGSSILQLTVPMVKPKLIPLPPLDEQKRIVEAIENIFTQIDEISNAIA